MQEEKETNHTPLSKEDAWGIIGAYYTRYGIVRHQIEAFDNFVLHVLPSIIQ